MEWVESEHPLFLLYTSGSTGKPKGVLHTTGCPPHRPTPPTLPPAQGPPPLSPDGAYPALHLSAHTFVVLCMKLVLSNMWLFTTG